MQLWLPRIIKAVGCVLSNQDFWSGVDNWMIHNWKNVLMSLFPQIGSFCLKFNKFFIFLFSFFFEDLHDDLCHTIHYMLKDSVSNARLPIRSIVFFFKGIAINFAPYRSKTLNKFVSTAERYSFECHIHENYDEDVFKKHLQVKKLQSFLQFQLKTLFRPNRWINIIHVIFIIQFSSYYVNVTNDEHKIWLDFIPMHFYTEIFL